MSVPKRVWGEPFQPKHMFVTESNVCVVMFGRLTCCLVYLFVPRSSPVSPLAVSMTWHIAIANHSISLVVVTPDASKPNAVAELWSHFACAGVIDVHFGADCWHSMV